MAAHTTKSRPVDDGLGAEAVSDVQRRRSPAVRRRPWDGSGRGHALRHVHLVPSASVDPRPCVRPRSDLGSWCTLL